MRRNMTVGTKSTARFRFKSNNGESDNTPRKDEKKKKFFKFLTVLILQKYQYTYAKKSQGEKVIAINFNIKFEFDENIPDIESSPVTFKYKRQKTPTLPPKKRTLKRETVFSMFTVDGRLALALLLMKPSPKTR